MISVIIAHHNDFWQLCRTVDTIMDRSSTPVEIVMVDDGSRPDQIPNMDCFLTCKPIHIKIKLARYDQHVGVAHARDVGRSIAFGDWLMFTDSHMIFPPEWDKRFLRHADERTNIIWSGVYESQDKDGVITQFYGSTLRFICQIKDKLYVLDQFPDSRPITSNSMLTSSIIGASYFIHKTWYDRIGGLDGLIGWGGDEQFLSLKTYLAGGECRVMDDLGFIHISQPPPVNRNPSWKILFNKMLITNVCLNHDYNSWKLMHRMWNRAINDDYLSAMAYDVAHSGTTIDKISQFEAVRVRTIQQVCERLGINTPEEDYQLLGI